MKSDDYKKLTAEVRAALASAGAEAHRLHHEEVGAGHLLLGLRAQPGRVSEVLRESGVVSLQRAREALLHIAPSAAHTAAARRMAPELLSVLDKAVAEQPEISASALCRALLSVENTATRLLNVLDVDRALVSSELRAQHRSAEGSREPATPLDERVQNAVENAEILATHVGRVVDDGDVAVMLVEQPGSSLARALLSLGITRELLEEALADTRPPPSTSSGSEATVGR